MEPITVAYMVIQLETGGTERQLVALLEGLDRSRFRPVVVVERAGGALEQAVRDLRIPIHVEGRRWRWDPLVPVRLARLLRRERVDVVHAFESMEDVYGVVAGVLGGVPVRLMTWLSLRYPRAHMALLWLAMPFATRLIANSEHARRWLQRRYQPASRVIAIPNGLDVEFYARARDVAAKRRELGLADDERPVLGMVARLRPEKDHETLLHATKLLVNRYPKLVLLLAGDGPRQAELERAAARMLAPGRCRFLGNRKDVADLYHVFDVSLLMTEYEGMPNAVMEAMAAARPVVATNVEGCADLIADGVNGVLVPPHDAPALADAVARVLGDEALARRLGAAAQRTMRERYSLRMLVERHERLYEELAARRRRR